MAAKGDFEVKVINKEVVAAMLPTQVHRLPQVNFCVFFCYRKPTSDCIFGSIVNILKKSLAETLVPYYVFSGEMVQNEAGEPELLCNNRGVDFVEAHADIELMELNLYNPDESIEGKLIPAKKHGLLAVQATQLKCGGLVVGCTFDHRVADAYSANMFFVSWTEMSRSKPLSTNPICYRSFISPRSPGNFDLSVSKLFVPLAKASEGTNAVHRPPISRIYYMKEEQVIQLQSWANYQRNCSRTTKRMRTKLEAFSAFLWKIIASGNCTADDKNCRMGIVVDGRSRLSRDDKSQAKLMSSYFGNVLTMPFGEMKNKELKEKPLSCVANEVHKFIQNAATSDHFLGLIDYVEAHRPVPMVAKIAFAPANQEEPAFVISSGQHFSLPKIDFGWGQPAFASYHFPWGLQAGYVMPMPSAKGNGDWIVYMHLAKEQIEAIETNAAHIFKPLDPDYLF